MGKSFFIILLVFVFSQAFSQNLVPNPSFEEVTDTTFRWSGTHFPFNKQMIYWESPTQGSPDILFEENLLIMHPPRPGVSLVGNHARSGNFMVGLKVFGCEVNTHHCKEYLQVKLKQTLIKGELYAYEYWVNPISSSIKVNSFGVALSENQIREDMIIGLLDIPSTTLNTEIVDTAPGNWYRISGKVEATIDSDYLLIGNFLDDSQVSSYMEEDGIDYGLELLHLSGEWRMGN